MDSYVIERAVPDRLDPRLGRNVNHDSRSRRYAFQARAGQTFGSVLHARYTPILDQGDLGSCTGNATLGALGTGPLYGTVPKDAIRWDQAQAVAIYSKASSMDDFPGAWPPDDTGSDGLSAAKAAQALGYISGYQHTFTFTDFMAALQVRPVIVGTGWYDSMFAPNADGLVMIEPGSVMSGGHEWMVRGYDADKGLIVADNSWGTTWGKRGTFYLTRATMTRLLAEQGDCTIFTPLTAPAPTPDPSPVTPRPPTPLATDLEALRLGTSRWRASRVGAGAAQAKQAVRTYLAQQGVLEK